MAHLLGMENASISLGSRPILTGVSLSLDAGSRVGVVGPNGAGKSTLLSLLNGALEPDEGRVTCARATRIVTLTQADDFAPGATVTEVVYPGMSEHEWASISGLRQIKDGLLRDVDLDAPVSTLSGGQRRRVALASCLSAPAEILILDEPTNHLDVEGVAWLAKYLTTELGAVSAGTVPGKAAGVGNPALVVVTHDRWFLDAVCLQMWEVVPGHDGSAGLSPVGGHVEQYEGGYAAYILARAERARQAEIAEEKRQNLLRKELAWLRRGAPARTSKPRFRIEAAEALIANVPPPRDTIALTRTAMTRLGKDVLDLEDVSFSYSDENGQPKEIFDHVTWRLAPGERVGIVGVNGAGKSSLLGLLSGKLQPDSGRVKTGKTVRLRTLSQDTVELAEVAHLRVVEAISTVRERIVWGDKELTASQLAQRLGFTRRRAWTQVSELSGGERRRLQLLRILIDDPNVLLLDEPTNDLDTDTLAAMEDLLDGWPGTLVVVSHDRYLLERLTDHQVAVLGDRKIRDIPGGVDEYLRLRAEFITSAVNGKTIAKGAGALACNSQSTGNNGTENAVENGAANAAKSKYPPGSAQEREARKQANKLLRQLEKNQELQTKLGADMTAASLNNDYEKLADLGKEDAKLKAEADALEAQWLALMEDLEG